jgi:hypothetical protein
MPLSFGMFPHTLYEFKVDIGGGLAVLYQLDCYQRWVVHVFLFLYGVRTELFFGVVGKADSSWVDKRFGDEDE